MIDFDGAEVGPYLQQMAATKRTASPKMTLGYVSEPGSKYNHSNDRTLQALKQEAFWFGIVIQSNATTAMNYAYNTGNSSYDPTGSIHLIYEEGRNALTINNSAYPKILSFMNDFVLKFTKQKQNYIRIANAGNSAALERQVETPIPVGFTVFNTAPYIPSTAEAETEIGTMCKFGSLLEVTRLTLPCRSDNYIFRVGSHALSESMMGKVPIVRSYIYRMMILPTLYFFSLFYLALSCAWKIDFGKFYGASGYVIY